MSSIPPDVFQMLAGGAGAFLGGLLLVWRAKKSLPLIINNVVQVFAAALKETLREDVREVVREELQPHVDRVKKLEGWMRHVELRVFKAEETIRKLTAGR